MYTIKITINNQIFTANFIENATTKTLLSKMPFELPMLNLYSRELTYRFKQGLPADEAQTSSYVVGDIAYWTPRHSFVIFYKQTGEVISNLQKVGHINSGDLTPLRSAGDTLMKFERI
ncbi:cyclophilin-like fold protein [Lactiplantibacillus sp. WILCCON 0030]|uniref:Cyclophilin-like fold protein n=1 Tax=Lactiplantibacillus brownii TaxID=3069269 RepID=A0ABU1AA00_9LACO|nr:cyclophilin-like fold protein [Lactiplantibacillus brownii]MDQ7937696.1 cyclophilin-like fold protein [Lactiplantibacillus brownii]